MQIERHPLEGAAGSAEPPVQPPSHPVEAPRVRKKHARVPRAVGIAKAPEPAEGAAPMDAEPPEALVAGGSATAPAPEAGGRAAAPETPQHEEDIEADIVDLPSLIQAYKKPVTGWF